ncbi:MAG TPA: penicillin-binding protein 1C [Pseudolabrys sp.]
MRRARVILAGAGGAIALMVIAAIAYVCWLGPAPLGQDVDYSHAVLDRNGALLRAYATKEGRWCLPATVDDVDPRFLKLLFNYEDKRFYEHGGVDPYAMTRAAFQLITQGHVVSGGSTLTMQVARLLEPREHRTFLAKLRQVTRAIEIEHHLSKARILSLYLSLAPYGGNLEGIRAASLAYFGKEPRRLSLAEAALLVALPQSPGYRRPDRFPDAARDARDRVLDRAEDIISADDIKRAKAEPMPRGRRQLPMLAPHAADKVVLLEPDKRVHRLTIDAVLQNTFEDLARGRAQALGPDVSVAILAVDNATGEVRARVASPDYFDTRRAGQVDMTEALRSPGSTLKPFIYGLGFEDGFIHPETLIDDRPARYGNYTPENFDLTFQGMVTVRKALQLSLNVPAIAALGKVGVSRLSARLTQVGAGLVLPKGEAPGLAMGLGGVGMKLSDLVMLYSGLARLGAAVPLVERVGEAEAPPRRLLDPVAAWYVGNVLIGAPPPENAPPGRIAFKTGTSYGYRDAWSVGFDGRMTIGVWVGRADGAPVPGLVGRASAAPILFDAFARTGLTPAPLAKAPKGVIFSTTAKLPPPLQRFSPAAEVGGTAEPPRIMFPPDGARLELSGGREPDPLALKIAGGRAPLTVMVNGVPLAPQGGHRTVFYRPDGPGFVRLTVMDARGASDSVSVRLQ